MIVWVNRNAIHENAQRRREDWLPVLFVEDARGVRQQAFGAEGVGWRLVYGPLENRHGLPAPLVLEIEGPVTLVMDQHSGRGSR